MVSSHLLVKSNKWAKSDNFRKRSMLKHGLWKIGSSCHSNIYGVDLECFRDCKPVPNTVDRCQENFLRFTFDLSKVASSHMLLKSSKGAKSIIFWKKSILKHGFWKIGSSCPLNVYGVVLGCFWASNSVLISVEECLENFFKFAFDPPKLALSYILLYSS